MDVLEEVLLSVLISVLLAVFVVRFVSSASSVHADVRQAHARAAKDVGAAEEDERRERAGNGDDEAVEVKKVGLVEEELPSKVEEEGSLEVEVGKLKEEEGVSSDVIDDQNLEVKGATFEPGNADSKEEVGGDVVLEDGNGEVRDEDDEWEGIEKSSLQDRFDSLTRFVASAAGEALLGSAGGDFLVQLYSLHKVATEGPCYEPPPSILKSSARAKWYFLLCSCHALALLYVNFPVE